ncbi:response regulator [Ramlibacter sp. AW1]|uniref:histidine kinase n=1 Tax=Ramlibacter aurantiacus TaxID=2801330 RepID=A0A936ZQ47_9BURK|nr:ATP-binding protein [Ramlibacter aurantiacus]MBL0420431.1 response regulator [Ramlibacter aurantiacus]
MQQQPPSPVDAAGADLYRRMVDSALDYAIVSCDETGLITSWSAGAERVFGWSEDEMLGQPLSRLFTPEDIEARVDEQEREVARARGSANDERWHVRKDGARFWASGELMRLAEAAEQPSGFVKVVRDQSREHREDVARQQLARDMQFLARASEELADVSDLQATLDTIARLAVPSFADWCTVDLLEPGQTLNRVAMAHPQKERLEQAQELIRRFPPDPRSSGGVWDVLRTGRPLLVPEVTPENIDKSVPDIGRREALRWLQLCSYIIVPLSAREQPFGVLTFATSESGRRYNRNDLALAMDLARRAAVAVENARLMLALRESDRAKDVFMATLAHELRNPLAPIWNGLSIIKRVPHDRARVEQVTGMIERQVGQLSRLVDDLLDVSRISNGKLELKKEPISLVRVLNSAVEISRPQIEGAHHTLTLTFPDEPAEVLGDAARLSQIFSNLLINSAKYTRRGGRISVAVETEADWLVVRVRDNGVGIAPEMLDRVFGLFTQAEQAGERSQGGLGIGLSLVEGLVRLHGGRVEARSEGLEKGSEFIVSLPRLNRAELPDAPAASGMAPDQLSAGPGRRILVVDDHIDAAHTVADLLVMSGNEVEVVHDGIGAVEATSRFRPDVVLLDIGLPDISGYEAARRIRKLEGVRQPMLIALTGWGQQQDKDLAAQAGFDQHWTKPVDPARLMALASR